ncbi:neurogenic locus notch homolog protein 2-like [Mytilus trossulus]|uniref:neurogenic locus notch homolog protein 2-like n=1 Tax=Mytilus trossulus TaxID=6551 RepID=UPI003007E0E7
MERLHHWLSQVLLLAVFLVKDGLSNSPCYFYPKHGVIQNWYPDGHFSESTHNDKHHWHYENSYSYQYNSQGKRSVLVKRSDRHAKYCQHTGQHHQEGGKHHIRVYDFHSQNHIWVDVTGGHCGSHDCCESGQPVFNYCQSSPCHNGGHCNNHNTGFTCQCRNGYHGYRCEHATTVISYSYKNRY